MPSDVTSTHFEDYSPIQSHKHELLKQYLGAWFPKLGSGFNSAMYLETHAGAGVYGTGDVGSPLVAIRTLQNHFRRDSILARCKVLFHLIEINEENFASLQGMVDREPISPGMKVNVVNADFTVDFRERLKKVRDRGQILPPTLVFMDPFGYTLPMDIVKEVLRYKNCEVIVTFMHQAVARALRDDSKTLLLDQLYGSNEWRDAREEEWGDRTKSVIEAYAKAVGARWTTKLRLTGQTDYTLMHFTNHPEGRIEMKKSLWAITGKFAKGGVGQLLYKDHPDQLTLLEDMPDLKPLEDALRKKFVGQTFVHADAVSWLVDEDYLEKHLHEVLDSGRRTGWLQTEYKKRFGPSMQDAPMTIVGESLF